MIVINSIHRYLIGQKIEVSVLMLEVEHFHLPYDLLYSIDSKMEFLSAADCKKFHSTKQLCCAGDLRTACPGQVFGTNLIYIHKNLTSTFKLVHDFYHFRIVHLIVTIFIFQLKKLCM